MYANYNSSIENVARWMVYNSHNAIRILGGMVEKKNSIIYIDTTSIFVTKSNNYNTFVMKNNYSRINQTHLYIAIYNLNETVELSV